MGFYDEVDINKDKLTGRTERLFNMRCRDTLDGYNVVVDGVNEVPMIIEKHTNPLNQNLHDLKATYLDSVGDFMHLGNMIDVPKANGKYSTHLAITKPSGNSIYSTYKIMPLEDEAMFGESVFIKTVMANKGFYDESSYTNETNVFEDKELRAMLIQYNKDTKTLELFDDIYVNKEHYKVVKIDNHTYKECEEEFGVLQVVIIDVPFGNLKVNDNLIKGICVSARVKDKVLNSISKEFLCNYDNIKRGDYVSFEYSRKDNEVLDTEETYLIINKPTMGEGYDVSLGYLCESQVNLLTGNVINGICEYVSFPAYYENNRTRIDKIVNNEHIKLENSSYMILMQNNETTKRIANEEVKRLWIGDKVYSVTGTDEFNTGILAIGLNISQKIPDDNEEYGIANYNSQAKAILGSMIDSQPTQTIVGDDKLYKGFANEYYLEGQDTDIIWSVNQSWITLNQYEGKCSIKYDLLKYIDEEVILTARCGDNTFTKKIYTKGF